MKKKCFKGRHKHKCLQCGLIWEHCGHKKGKRRYHICRVCGITQFKKLRYPDGSVVKVVA